MSNIDKRALREAAEKATPGPWYVHDKPCEDGNYGIDTSDKEFLAEAVVWWGFSRQSIWREEDAKHIAAANPATVLALLDELEAKDRRITEKADIIAKQERWIKDVEATMIAATDRAEAAEKRISALEGREVTLPPTFWYEHDDLSRDVPVMDARKVKKSIRDAGIRIAAAAGKGE